MLYVNDTGVENGFVAQISLRLGVPLPQTASVCGHGTWYAKRCEAVEGRSPDVDLRILPIKVTRGDALTG